MQAPVENKCPVILYPPTFTRNVCSAPYLMREIERLAKDKPWEWIITFHPKLTDPEIIAGYKKIAEENANVTFFEGADKLQLLHKADVMLCDSSSIILEFMFLGKNFYGDSVELLPCIGKGELWLSVEERDTVILFQTLDMLA